MSAKSAARMAHWAKFASVIAISYFAALGAALAINRAMAAEAPLPTSTSPLFAASGVCVNCHLGDGATYLVDNSGHDVSMIQDWRSSMMANAFRDPFFQAVLEAEVARFPQHKAFIEAKCLTCHAPMYYTQTIRDGLTTPTLAGARLSGLANDGVSCTLCHQIQPGNLGTRESFTGGYVIGDDRVIFGPYPPDNAGLMLGSTGFDVQFGEHKQSGNLCGTCHNLFTPTLNAMGDIVGEFPEQTIHLEWVNSIYGPSGSQRTDCQTCHMPITNDGIIIARVPSTLPERDPFWQHHFVGGNVFMTRMLGDNVEALGLTASPEAFERTTSRTLAMLASAATLDIESVRVGDEATTVVLMVANHAGHKFTAGYPSRRFWLRVRAVDSLDNVLMDSGAWNEDGEILDEDLPYEPHRDVIAAPGDVQIYEGVIADTDGQVNHSLLRAAYYLKDNRIPPVGFTSAGPDYDDIKIVGHAATDLNFNRYEEGGEGSGTDQITYIIPTAGAEWPVKVTIQAVYQSINPAYAANVFTQTGPAISTFAALYAEADKTPIPVATVERELFPSTSVLWMIR